MESQDDDINDTVQGVPDGGAGSQWERRLWLFAGYINHVVMQLCTLGDIQDCVPF